VTIEDRTLGVMRLSAIIAIFLIPAAVHASPCTGIEQVLTQTQKVAFLPSIERHLNNQLGKGLGQSISMSPEDIFQVFRVGKWHIVYVNSHVSDEPYLFYNSAPDAAERYLTAWAGGATMDEGAEIYAWTLREAPGIPHKLASCFSWHVTMDREK
jgi:hypothetical protein